MTGAPVQKPAQENSTQCPICGQVLPGSTAICPNDGHVLNPLSTKEMDLLVGSVVAGKYEIVSLIGKGGMSVVYKARNLEVNSTVAVKMLKKELISDKELLARFQQEAKAAQSLTHSNIISVHEFGVMPNGQPYLVMDYLKGELLADAIEQNGRLPLKRCLPIFIKACEALAHCHQHNIIHRDIKPGNIMLVETANDTDVVKLFDFGFCKLAKTQGRPAQQLTQTGDVLGTPLYMSPEQSRGKNLDSRSDIYSLGCVMYEAITGKAPLVGSNVLETMQKQINERPESITSARPDLYIPDELTEILFKAMEKEPEKRYQSMAELKRDLENFNAKLLGKPSGSQANLPRLKSREVSLRKNPLPKPVKFLMIGVRPFILLIAGFAVISATLFIIGTVVHHAPEGENDESVTKPHVPTDPKTSWATLRQQAAAAANKGDYTQAETLLMASLQPAARLSESEDRLATSWLELSQVYLKHKRLSDSAKAAAKALEYRHKLGQSNQKPVTEIYVTMGLIDYEKGSFKQADSHLQQALAIQKRELDPLSPELATTDNALAKVAQAEGSLTRAEAYYEQALAIRQLVQDKKAIAETLTDYAQLLRKLNRDKDAKKLETQLKALGAAGR
jgi:serine/threonine-protein kinase